jgi:hypothetical protein
VPVAGDEQNQVRDPQRSLNDSSDLADSRKNLTFPCPFPPPHHRFARRAHFGSSSAAASHQGIDEPGPALVAGPPPGATARGGSYPVRKCIDGVQLSDMAARRSRVGRLPALAGYGVASTWRASGGNVSSHPPLTRAVWQAHYELRERGEGVPAPEVVEEIARTAIAVYLNAIAAENKIQTGYEAGVEGGSSWVHRAVYSPDLQRMADQARSAPPVGAPAEKDNPFDW